MISQFIITADVLCHQLKDQLLCKVLQKALERLEDRREQEDNVFILLVLMANTPQPKHPV